MSNYDRRDRQDETAMWDAGEVRRQESAQQQRRGDEKRRSAAAAPAPPSIWCAWCWARACWQVSAG